MSYIHNRYNKQYKKVFSNPLFLENLLKSFVHEGFIHHLDFSTLKKVNISEIIEKSIPDKFIPEFSYYSVIINSYDKRKLFKIKNAVSAIFLMENSSMEEYDDAYTKLVDLIRESSENEIETFIYWINNFFLFQGIKIPKLNYKDIKDPMEVIGMMTTANERYKQRLLKEGREEERMKFAKRLLEAGSDIQFVSKMTKLSITEIKEHLATK